MGIEPTTSAWKAEVLPLNYTRAYQQATFPNLTHVRFHVKSKIWNAVERT